MADWIISFIPQHRVYLEPYFGSGAVLFNKEPVGIETVNDLDKNVVNLFSVIRNHPGELADLLEMTPWARDEYYDSYEETDDEIEKARRYIVRCWQAFATRVGYRTGWRHSAQGQCPNMPEQWAKIPERVFQVAGRLKHVQIENQDAVKLIEKYNHPDCVLYLDPPYTHDTRAKGIYNNDGSEESQIHMLEAILHSESKVLLSGYDNPLYQEYLKDWRVEKKHTAVERGQSKTECLWMNFAI